MKELAQQLQSLFSGTELPVWQQGCVPDEAALPHAVWSAEPGEDGTVTVTGRCRESAARAAELLDTVAALIPAQGLLLPLDRCTVTLTRRDSRSGRDEAGIYWCSLTCALCVYETGK